MNLLTGASLLALAKSIYYCNVIDKHHILDVVFVIFHDVIGKTVCVSKYIGRDEDN